MAFTAQAPSSLRTASRSARCRDRSIRSVSSVCQPASAPALAPSPIAAQKTGAVSNRRTRTIAMSNQIINQPEQLVQQALDGMLMSNPNLVRLDGYPDIKVVMNKNMDKNKVSVIAGGGSGHEPAHAGYVGDNMLTAAVAGEVFASPSAEAVLAAIRATTGPAGCLLITMNYTGDRLHFGLALEQAKAEGYKVDLLVVGEDVAIDKPGIAGRRGLAATAMVNKIAGAAAGAGASLEEVHKVAQYAAENSATMGVALRVCTLPGKPPSDRLKQGEMEVGLGIHGEPGIDKTKTMSAEGMTQRMLKQLQDSPFFKLQSGERVVAMVNNLGSSTNLEMACATRETLNFLQNEAKVTVERCFVGTFMTSLDMGGFSLTVMRLPKGKEGDDILAKLDAPVGAAHWPHVSPKVVPKVQLVPMPKGKSDSLDAATKRPEKVSPAGADLERIIQAAAEVIVKEAKNLNDIDIKVGDGDCGDTLAHGANAVLADMKECYPVNDVAPTMGALARSVRKAVGGTSGALYEIAFTSAARSLRECGTDKPGLKEWAAAMKAGTDSIMKYGNARPGFRTMLDALVPATEALEKAASEGKNVVEAAEAVAHAAQEGAKSTQGMTAAAGRSSYVPEDVLKSYPDPGAIAVGQWLAAAAEKIKENNLVKAK